MRHHLVPAWLLAALLLASLLLASAAPLGAQAPSTRQPQGLRENRPQWFALTGARVVPSPGEMLDSAVVVIRDGIVVQVGGEAPAGAKRIDLAGRTIYPGLIDAYSEAEAPEELRRRGAVYWNPQVRPQLSAADFVAPDDARDADYRGVGVVARLVAPQDGVLRGRSAVVSTGAGPRGRRVLRGDAAQHALLSLRRRSRKQYPNSPMGAVAVARQAFYDAQWLEAAERAYQADPSLPRPERNDSLAALQRVLDGQLTIFEAPNELYLLRADRFAREFSLRAAFRGSGHEYKRLTAVKQTGRPVIVPLNFPKAPNVLTAEAAEEASLEELMHWDIAPENPARLQAAGVPIALTAHGLDGPQQLLKAVRQAVRRGLAADDALRALTITPSGLLGLDKLLGTIEEGKLASLVVVDGDLFDEGKIVETWVEGRRHVAQPAPLFDVAGTWQAKIQGKPAGSLTITLQGEDKLKGTARAGGKSKPQDLAAVALRGAILNLRFDGKPLQRPGPARLSAVIDAKGDAWQGSVVWSDGSQSSVTASRSSEPAKAEDPEAGKQPTKKSSKKPAAKKQDGDEDAKKQDGDEDGGRQQDPPAAASFAVNYPLGAFGRREPPEQPQALLLTHATIWTCGPAGILEDASLLIRRGRVAAVGRELEPPAGAVVVDLEGRHVTPGIIDCHSHMATDGGVNESAQAVTAEVRIGDFIDCDDISIYRQLAGGVTSSNILHGSANPIGGQNQVIKLRWGALPEQMKFAEAPQGIKFALGENVKQSNWGDDYTTRYPQTRMGVVEIIEDTLQAAREYRRAQRRRRQTGRGLPVRRDLELEAVAEILEKTRWIHCHSYRQDEILALIRTLDRNDVTIGTFQHILEGYKVADAMAEHGAMGSAFSDWWAYKFEVFDAIPFNGALMHRAGVVVSFNSDDRELGRRLNLEAAKAVKYGGLPPEEALKFVTLNPARQLRIDQHVGSLETGKHADLAVWSGSPLSTFSRCEQTWIDGRKYFDRQQDVAARQQHQQRRNTLIQKVLDSGKPMLKPGEHERDISALWPREDEFCHHHGHGHGHDE